MHPYGSHLFHTSNSKVLDFVASFAEFNDYRHTVWANYQGDIFSLPVNLQTICKIYGKSFNPHQARELIAFEIDKFTQTHALDLNSLEGWAISKVGPTLYNALIKGYTQKQWQTNPKDLPSSTISRLPIRYNFDNRYFSDDF